MQSMFQAAFGFMLNASKTPLSETPRISLPADAINSSASQSRFVLSNQLDAHEIVCASICYNIDSNGFFSVNSLNLTGKNCDKKTEQTMGECAHNATADLLASLNQSQAVQIARSGSTNFDAPGASGQVVFYQDGKIEATCRRLKKVVSQSETIQDLGSIRSGARVQVEYLIDAIESRGFDRIRFEYGQRRNKGDSSLLAIYVGAPDQPMIPLDAGRHSMFEPICRSYLGMTHPEYSDQNEGGGRVMIDLLVHKLRHQRQNVRVVNENVLIQVDPCAPQMVEQQSQAWAEPVGPAVSRPRQSA